MPAMKSYVVTETREVKVTATSILDASKIANAAFTYGQNSDNGVRNGPEGVWGNTTSAVAITHFAVDVK